MARSPHCSTARADFERHTCSPAPSLVLGAGPILGCLRGPCFEEPVFLGACVFLGVCVFLGPRVPRRCPAFRGPRVPWEARVPWVPRVPSQDARPAVRGYVMQRSSVLPMRMGDRAAPGASPCRQAPSLPGGWEIEPHLGRLHVDRHRPSRADGRTAAPGASPCRQAPSLPGGWENSVIVPCLLSRATSLLCG